MDTALLHDLRSRILELFDEEGERAGHEFRKEEHAHRLANLVDKGDVFQRAIVLPQVLDLVKHVLGEDCKLSSLNARSADPGTDVGQPLHVDMGAIADERGYWVCNTVWLLDDFTRDNGPTRMIPGSHKWGTRPQDVMSDPYAQVKAHFENVDGVTVNSGRGAQGLKVGGKMIAMFSKGDLLLKLPAAQVAELVESGRGLPYELANGKVMANYLLVPAAKQRSWIELAEMAAAAAG